MKLVRFLNKLLCCIADLHFWGQKKKKTNSEINQIGIPHFLSSFLLFIKSNSDAGNRSHLNGMTWISPSCCNLYKGKLIFHTLRVMWV